jgi:gas vesicle protein
MNQNDDLLTVVLAFAIGGLIGAGLMAIFAPQSGEQTREMLLSKSHDLKDKAVGTTTSTGKAVGEFFSGARERATNLFYRGQDIESSVKSNIEEEAKSKSVQFGQVR